MRKIPTLEASEIYTQFGGRRVFVYFNLHKKLWSIRDCQTGRVLCHSGSFRLWNCKPKVSEAGRQRVIREKKKNVHAGIIGTLPMEEQVCWMNWKISYNPYKGGNFYCKRIDGSTPPYKGSDALTFCNKSVWDGCRIGRPKDSENFACTSQN